MEKSGLVVEGGGMLGIYAAGVLDVMMDHRFHFDGVIGVSAGAIHGCTMVAGQREELVRREQEGSIFVIRPSKVLTIDRMCHDPEKIQETYDIGRQDMENVTDSLQEWLGECKG